MKESILHMSHHELRSPPGMKWKAETDSTAFRVADFAPSLNDFHAVGMEVYGE
jgi:hypothetical protein